MLSVLDGEITVPNGAQNITITCYCSNSFKERLDTVRWFFNETRILLKHNVTKGHPYIVLNEALATLIIPTFNNSYSGTYTCGNDNDMDKTTVKSSIRLFVAVKPGKLCR